MTERKYHPQIWALSRGFLIIDPDGWRDAGRDFHEPVTGEEFDALYPSCTIDSHPHPGALDFALAEAMGARNRVAGIRRCTYGFSGQVDRRTGQ